MERNRCSENGWLFIPITGLLVKGVIDLHAVYENVKEGRKNAMGRREKISQYAPEMGGSYTSSAEDMGHFANLRTVSVFMENPNAFIPLDTITKAIFPAVYHGEQKVSREHRRIAYETAVKIAHSEGMAIESTDATYDKRQLRYRPAG